MKQEALSDVPSSGCDVNLLRKHFQNHFTCDTTKKTPESLISNPPEFMESLLAISASCDINISPPDETEIKSVLSKFKNGKAANDIPPELIKYARTSPEFLNLISDILTDLWTNFQMPQTWAISKLKTLYKNKGSKKDPKMYRGLSISSSLCKLAVCIILKRQTDWYELQLAEPRVWEQGGG